jgi:zinc transport system ATP-binding protein
MEPALVAAANLGVKRGGHWVVRGVDISVARGELVTMIGPNGGGKSTIAAALLGLLPANEGEVRRKPSIKISYVPQKMFADWTLPMRVERFMHLTGGATETDVSAALADAGAEHLRSARLHALSGGEFQRVMLARGIARRPDLLVLDEPVQGVDFSGELALYDLIHRTVDRLGCGVLLISHDLHMVMARTDRVFCIQGHVCCSGPPEHVAADAEYRRLFGPDAASVLAVYKHDLAHHHAHDDPGADR